VLFRSRFVGFDVPARAVGEEVADRTEIRAVQPEVQDVAFAHCIERAPQMVDQPGVVELVHPFALERGVQLAKLCTLDLLPVSECVAPGPFRNSALRGAIALPERGMQTNGKPQDRRRRRAAVGILADQRQETRVAPPVDRAVGHRPQREAVLREHLLERSLHAGEVVRLLHRARRPREMRSVPLPLTGAGPFPYECIDVDGHGPNHVNKPDS